MVLAVLAASPFTGAPANTIIRRNTTIGREIQDNVFIARPIVLVVAVETG